MMFKWRRAAVLAAALVLTVTGCTSSPAADDGAAETGGTLTLGSFVPPATFSAANANWGNVSIYTQSVYDTLLRAAPDGTVEPNLATEWEYDEAKTALTLTLRDDVTFTDGAKFDAEAAAQNLMRFKAGTSPDASFLVLLESAEAIDSTHVVLNLAAPDPAMLTYLTQAAGVQGSPDAYDNADIETVPVGSGPYILDTDATVAGSSYSFTKNPDYWNPDDQHYDELKINVYADSTSLLNALRSGQVNASTVQENTIVDQAIAAGFTVNPLELNWQGLIIGDRNGTITPALGDVRVRQAINYAFDREGLLEVMSQGYGTVTEQIFPVTSPSFDEDLDSTYDYDPEKAKELLAEAGYPDGFAITMPTTAALGASNFALVQQQLGDIGIDVTYEDLQVNDYISAIIGGKYSMVVMALQQDPTDWQLVSFQVAKTANWNGFHTDDPQVEAWVATIQTGSESEAETAGEELNAYLVEQGWFAPWFRPSLSFLTDANTSVTVQVGNAYPYLWNLVPKN